MLLMNCQKVQTCGDKKINNNNQMRSKPRQSQGVFWYKKNIQSKSLKMKISLFKPDYTGKKSALIHTSTTGKQEANNLIPKGTNLLFPLQLILLKNKLLLAPLGQINAVTLMMATARLSLAMMVTN